MNSEKKSTKQNDDQSEAKITMKIPFAKKGLKGMFNVSVSFKNQYQLALQDPAIKPNQQVQKSN